MKQIPNPPGAKLVKRAIKSILGFKAVRRSSWPQLLKYWRKLTPGKKQ